MRQEESETTPSFVSEMLVVYKPPFFLSFKFPSLSKTLLFLLYTNCASDPSVRASFTTSPMGGSRSIAINASKSLNEGLLEKRPEFGSSLFRSSETKPFHNFIFHRHSRVMITQ